MKVMIRTPDGHGRLELTKFRTPKLVKIEPTIAPPNKLGLRSVMFAVESVDDTVARLCAVGSELIGEVAQYDVKRSSAAFGRPIVRVQRQAHHGSRREITARAGACTRDADCQEL